MTTTEQEGEDSGIHWDHIGRAAEHFARRVARDARQFAARLEEHAGDFARDVSREWRWGGCAQPHGARGRAAPDVRRIFEDIRGVLSDVLDGVDELVGSVFQEPAHRWTRVVYNRDAACGACGRDVRAGSEGWIRRTAGGKEYRCLTCGIPEERPAGP